MSSIVNLDMCLIASKGLLPVEKLHEVFMDTLEELHGNINNNILIINGFNIGTISLKDRIIIQTYSENENNVKNATKELRDVFTRRSLVVAQNYKNELEQERKRALESDSELAEIQTRIHDAEQKIKMQEKAISKQQMSSCEAIVLELKESAENQGYDIVEEKTEQGTQLQFVRRIY